MSNWALTQKEEADVLQFDPWGDRDATYRVIREGFCVARFCHTCAICFGPVLAGERHWYRAETDDGKCQTFRFCPECCWCIAHRYDDWGAEDNDGWTRMYERWKIGRKRADERPTNALAR